MSAAPRRKRSSSPQRATPHQPAARQSNAPQYNAPQYNAPQSNTRQSKTHQPARRPLKPQPRGRQHSSRVQIRQRGIALEMGILLSVNLVIVAAATAAIVKLVPHHIAQRAKLQVLQSEVDALDQRVGDLRQNFNTYFDPQRSLINQRELGNQAVPGQRPVQFVQPEPGSPGELGSGR